MEHIFVCSQTKLPLLLYHDYFMHDPIYTMNLQELPGYVLVS